MSSFGEAKSMQRKKRSEIRKADEWFGRFHNVCTRYSRWSDIALAFLVGVIGNTVADPTSQGFIQAVGRLFNVRARHIAWLCWLAVIVWLLLWIGRVGLARYARQRKYATRLAEIYHEKIDPSVRHFQTGNLGWGMSLTLQDSPDLQKGWRLHDVIIEFDPTEFVVPANLASDYQRFVTGEFQQNFTEDAPRLRLTQRPVAFTDNKRLRLKVSPAKWSQVRFYQDHILTRNVRVRAECIERVLRGPIDFPNSLALLLVVGTSDGYVLLTRSSSGVTYYPGRWACSIGEHLDEKDFDGARENIAHNWLKRALLEELELDAESFSLNNARFMAAFLECQIVNPGIAAVVELNYDKETVRSIIQRHQHKDKEAREYSFIRWADIPRELAKGTREYHPSTGLRMFYAGLYKFGAPELNRRILDAHSSE